MNKLRSSYLQFAVIWTLIMAIAFVLAAYRMYSTVIAKTVFRFPYSMFLLGLIKGYWWIPVIFVPLLSWASVRVLNRR